MQLLLGKTFKIWRIKFDFWRIKSTYVKYFLVVVSMNEEIEECMNERRKSAINFQKKGESESAVVKIGQTAKKNTFRFFPIFVI